MTEPCQVSMTEHCCALAGVLFLRCSQTLFRTSAASAGHESLTRHCGCAARSAWGTVFNFMRAFTTRIQAYAPDASLPARQQLLRWMIAFAYLMRSHLIFYRQGSDSLEALLLDSEVRCLPRLVVSLCLVGSQRLVVSLRLVASRRLVFLSNLFCCKTPPAPSALGGADSPRKDVLTKHQYTLHQRSVQPRFNRYSQISPSAFPWCRPWPTVQPCCTHTRLSPSVFISLGPLHSRRRGSSLSHPTASGCSFGPCVDAPSASESTQRHRQR